MNALTQKRAVENYRKRLAERGMARFEVLGRNSDRELVRAVARRLAEGDAESDRLRSAIDRHIAEPALRRGGILEALRRSPLVGADAIPDRPFEPGRDFSL